MDHIILPPRDDGAIPRSKMPQVDDGDIPSLLVFLGALDIGFSAGYIDPNTISAHQAIDVEKALAIPDKWLKTPCLISKDGVVIDGDHRWYRHCVDKTLMPYLRIEEDFNTALEFIFKFPATYEEAK
jgi:hypothetical protein